MSRRLFIILSFIFILFFQIPFIKGKVVQFTNSLKKELSSFIANLKHSFDLYIDQKDTLEKLTKENQFLKDKIEEIAVKYAVCKDLKYFNKLNLPNIVFTQVISYASLPDFTQVYIDYNNSFNTPRGLVYNNLAAGIAIKNFKSYSLALLNSNKKTSYTIFIGKNEIPGIFYGKINTIKYIPKFKKVNIGDIVITSGLDKVFYKGAKVGIITEVIEKNLYQEAKVKLFYNDLNPNFFYIIRKEIK